MHVISKRNKNLFISILINTGITAAQFAGGLFSGSLALISDAIHNLSDVVSLIISYIASKLSTSKASFKRTFGFKRAEILAAYTNALFLIFVAIYLIYEAIERFITPVEIKPNLLIYFSIIAIIGNGVSVLLLKNDADDNLNIKSAYIHLFSDMLASVAVLISGLVIKYFKFYLIDSILTVAIAIYLIIMGIDLLIKSAKILMLFTPKRISLKTIVNKVNNIEKVERLHHVHLWYLNDTELHLEGHLQLKENVNISCFDEILLEIENLLEEDYGINHITLQPEFNKNDSKSIIVQD